MDSDEAMVLVFQGDAQDVLFLVSLLESGGITAHVVSGGRANPDTCLYVPPAEAADARACVEDFERNGKRQE